MKRTGSPPLQGFVVSPSGSCRLPDPVVGDQPVAESNHAWSSRAAWVPLLPLPATVLFATKLSR
eukprot:482438-Amphidinium_carterae.1